MNDLTNGQIERLAVLGRALAHAQEAIAKIHQFGYEGSDNLTQDGATGKGKLLSALGEVRMAMILLCDQGDLDKKAIHYVADYERQRILLLGRFNKLVAVEKGEDVYILGGIK